MDSSNSTTTSSNSTSKIVVELHNNNTNEQDQEKKINQEEETIRGDFEDLGGGVPVTLACASPSERTPATPTHTPTIKDMVIDDSDKDDSIDITAIHTPTKIDVRSTTETLPTKKIVNSDYQEQLKNFKSEYFNNSNEISVRIGYFNYSRANKTFIPIDEYEKLLFYNTIQYCQNDKPSNTDVNKYYLTYTSDMNSDANTKTDEIIKDMLQDEQYTNYVLSLKLS
jgi:hypothetical protein